MECKDIQKLINFDKTKAATTEDELKKDVEMQDSSMDVSLRNKPAIYNFRQKGGINGGYGNWKKWGSIYQDTRDQGSPKPAVSLFSEGHQNYFRRNLYTILSLLYAMLVTVLGCLLQVTDSILFKIYQSKIFIVYMAAIGLLWLMFYHYSLISYKRKVNNYEEYQRLAIQEHEIHRRQSNPGDNIVRRYAEPPKKIYSFMKGRHAGSYYLKIGAAIFAFGHLLHEGLSFGQQMLLLSHNRECFEILLTIVHVIVPFLTFYELFMLVKYSNVIIRCNQGLACFGFMHLIATSICLWLGTLAVETSESINKHIFKVETNNDTDHISANVLSVKVQKFHLNFNKQNQSSICSSEETRRFGEKILPFLQPFTVEYNLILVGVWFLQWCHISYEDAEAIENKENIKNSYSVSIRKKFTDSLRRYRHSMGSFSIDCTAVHTGLFIGISIFFITIAGIISYILFVDLEDTVEIAKNISIIIKIALFGGSVIALFMAYFQIAKLKICEMDQAIFLDNILLLIPIPLVFINCIINMAADLYYLDYMRIALTCLQLIQVMVQTTFLIDALRRHSPSPKLQLLKPGRQIITMLIMINLALWLWGNVEIKYYVKDSSYIRFYGYFLSSVLTHITIPFVLFYRFHSTVCLADIWKSAYESEEIH